MLTDSERRACRAHGQHRSTQRKVPRGETTRWRCWPTWSSWRAGTPHGYRKIAALLRAAGWLVNDKRVGAAVAAVGGAEGTGPPVPRRAGCGTGWLLCPAAARAPQTTSWSYDFVEARTHDGRKSAC